MKVVSIASKSAICFRWIEDCVQHSARIDKFCLLSIISDFTVFILPLT